MALEETSIIKNNEIIQLKQDNEELIKRINMLEQEYK